MSDAAFAALDQLVAACQLLRRAPDADKTPVERDVLQASDTFLAVVQGRPWP